MSESKEKKLTLTNIVENLEKSMIADTLREKHGHQGATAEELGISRRILGYKLQKYGISPK